MIATSTIKAGNQANITALGDLSVQGGDVQAKNINLIALGDVTLTGVQNKQVYGGGNDTTTVTTTQSLNLQGDNVNIQGVGQNSNVTLVAANVDAANKATIAANGDVTIASGEDRTTHEWTTTHKDCNWWGKCTTTVTHGVEDKTTQVGSDVKGATVDISAGNNLTTVASTIEGGDVSLSAQGKIDYLAALNVDKSEVQSKSSSSWFGIDIRWFSLLATAKSETNDSSIQTRAAATQLQSEGDILSESGADTKLQGTQVKAQNFTVNAGVGPNADPNAKVIIEGVKETLQTSHTEKSESVMWQSMSGNGVTEETLKLAQINAKTKFNAPGGIDVQLPAGDPLKEQIQTLSKQPGMEWLNDLSQRKDVNWNEVKLLKDSWQYEHEGLTQAGAIIVAIAVTIATADATGSAATSITGASQGAAYSATQAALSAAISQAAVTLANNKGDIGKTLQDMGKSENLKSIITSAVTAGALQGINPDWMKQLSATSEFTQKAVINLTNAAVSATIKTAIMGGSYEDNLTASLKTAGIDTVAGWAASNIGQGYKNGDGTLSELQGQYIAHKVAHALLGCASAAAKDTSCAAGAIGGAVGEAFAEMYGQSKYGTADGSTLTATQQQEVLNMSKLVTAAVAGMTGKDAQAAVDAAQNAVVNNFLFKQDKKALAAAKAACASANEAACMQVKNLEVRDKALDQLQEKYAGELTKTQVKALIKDVADVYAADFKKYGVDANDFLLTMANKESTLQPSSGQKNDASFQGLYQFSEDLALNKFNIGNADASIRLDPVWSTAAAAKSALETAATLTAKGIPVTPENLYIAHQQGMTGFVALFNAPSDELAGKVLSQFKKTEELGFKSVASNLHGNSTQQAEQAKTMTAGDFLRFLSNSFNSNRLSK